MATTEGQYFKTAYACRVAHSDGIAHVLTPDGKLLPHQISCKVICKVNQPPYVVVKMRVNLDDTIEINEVLKD